MPPCALDIRRIQSIKEGDRVMGSRTRGKVVKNKVAAPFREAEFDILYGEGVSREGDLIDLGVEQGLLEKSGTWISYGGERIGQGRENARVFLKENIAIRDKIEVALRKQLGLVPQAQAGTNGAAPAEKPVAEKRARKLRHPRPQPALPTPIGRDRASDSCVARASRRC